QLVSFRADRSHVISRARRPGLGRGARGPDATEDRGGEGPGQLLQIRVAVDDEPDQHVLPRFGRRLQAHLEPSLLTGRDVLAKHRRLAHQAPLARRDAGPAVSYAEAVAPPDARRLVENRYRLAVFASGLQIHDLPDRRVPEAGNPPLGAGRV